MGETPGDEDSADGYHSALEELRNEIGANLANEIAKTVAQLKGLDPMTAAVIGGGAAGTVKAATGALNMFRRRRDRGLVAIEAAEQASGMRADELFERALEDDRKLDLLSRAIDAATREADERRVRFYGRIAAGGVAAQEQTKIDHAARVFSALAALETPDITVLLHITAESEPVAWYIDRRFVAGQARHLDEEMPELSEVLDPILVALERSGLVTPNFTPRPVAARAVVVTRFGRRCADELRQADAGV